jgi:D-alanine-D-alanine ligase
MRRTDWRGRAVGILYNARASLVRGLARDALSEADTLRTVALARRTLRALGVRVVDLGLRGDARRVVARLARRPPDVVLNLCDAPLGDVDLEPHVPAALELLGIPYTGAGPAALDLCRHKPVVKERLAAAGIPTPAWTVVGRAARPPAWDAWPAIVKPAAEDASCGIDRRSVVHDRRALGERVAFLQRRYREPVLVERFVGGRELNVALVGGAVPRVLPYGEIDFSEMPSDRPRIVTFDAKWCAGGAEDRGTRPIAARPLPAAVRRAMRDHALAAWHITGVRDYARVDFRLDERGRPYVLEVNPNPDLSPEAGLARAWARAGGDWPGLLRAILAQALRRRPR